MFFPRCMTFDGQVCHSAQWTVTQYQDSTMTQNHTLPNKSITCLSEKVAMIFMSRSRLIKGRGEGRCVFRFSIHADGLSGHRFEHHTNRHTRWISVRVEDDVGNDSRFAKRHILRKEGASFFQKFEPRLPQFTAHRKIWKV